MPDYPDNSQPTLVINPVIRTAGIFPPRDGGYGYISETLGQVHFLATNYTPDYAGVAQMNGDLIPITSNTALFSIIGTMYGGNGTTNFGLPDLGGRVATGIGTGDYVGEIYGSNLVGLTQQNLPPSSGGSYVPFENAQPSLTIGWYINVAGIYPSPDGSGGPSMIGALNLFTGNFAPNGALPADGRLLPISEYEALFSLIGTTYGGDGQSTFALPDLRGRSPVGVGNNYLGNFTLGQTLGSETTGLTLSNMPASMGGLGLPVDNHGGGLVLTPLIALQGIFGSFSEGEMTLAEITWFAGNFAPRGYAIATGQLLAINTNQALFSLMGTTYGGDGRVTFALPDLRGRVMAGDGSGHVLGQTYGTNGFYVTEASIPALNVNGGPGNDTLYGGGSGDILSGGIGNDTLDGNGGGDALFGGPGDDTHHVEDAGDVVTENLDEGTDLVRTPLASYVLPDNVELLRGTSAAGQTLVGNSLDNTTIGGSGNDTINGLLGDDTASGGLGNDTYYVAQAFDIVSELANEGTDRILTRISYTLPDNVEILQLQLAGLTGTGNGLDNDMFGTAGSDGLFGMDGADRLVGLGGDDTLEGGAGNDTAWGGDGNDLIDGGTGADTMYGQAGDDIYLVDDAGDLPVEEPGGGTDLVQTTLASYALRPNIENLTGMTASGHSLTGNALDNVVMGGTGNDTINGADGSDAMFGRAGDDTYYVAQAGDTVTELAGEGTDKVLTKVSFTLPDNVEILQLQVAGLTGTGNAGANTLVGSAGGDTLLGMAGNDTINGGTGNDDIDGGADNDSLFGLGDNDTLAGGAGNDILSGGDGDDRLAGGSGQDRLLGGSGADTFAFTEAPGAADADLVLDFASGVDTIELASAAFTGLGAGALPGAAFVLGTAAGDGDDRVIYDQATGRLWFDPDGSGGEAAVLFATLGETAHPAVAATDFVVV